MCLLLALTGNWGKQGAGIRSWAVGMFDGQYFLARQAAPGPGGHPGAPRRPAGDDGRLLLAQDPTLTEEIIVAEMSYQGPFPLRSSPSAFFWYHHCGYGEALEQSTGWNDPSMKRSFDEYIQRSDGEGMVAGTRA